jgi:hypothetical protein
MKTASFLLLCVITSLVCSNEIQSQYDPIPKEQIPVKIKEFSDGTLKDSIFWAVVGFYRQARIRFSSVLENTLYVCEQGIYYRMDFADDKGNPVIANVFFVPFNRQKIPKNPTSDFVYELNEHMCECQSKIGYPQIIKKGIDFFCEESDDDDNIKLLCHDIETLQIFIQKHYTRGIDFQSRLTTIPVTVKELTED